METFTPRKKKKKNPDIFASACDKHTTAEMQTDEEHSLAQTHDTLPTQSAILPCMTDDALFVNGETTKEFKVGKSRSLRPGRPRAEEASGEGEALVRKTDCLGARSGPACRGPYCSSTPWG